LSMGMSHDLEAAVLEGATIVRVGTAIFGERESMDDELRRGFMP
jgi:PLP dependent protein